MKKFIFSFILIHILYFNSAAASEPFPNDSAFQQCASDDAAGIQVMNDRAIERDELPLWFLSVTVKYIKSEHRTDIQDWACYSNQGCQPATICTHADPPAGSPNSFLAGPITSIKVGNRNVCPSFGSTISPSKKSVIEEIPIDGSDVKLNYSSEFNPRRLLNKSVSENIYFDYTPGSSYRFRVANQTTGAESILGAYAGSPAALNWVWNQIDGNISTHPAFKRGSFKTTFESAVNMGQSSNGSRVISVQVCEDSYLCTSLSNPSYIDPTTSNETFWLPRYDANQILSIYYPEVWGLNGWTFSNHHYFDRASKIVYLGTGEKKTYENFVTLNISGYGNVDMVSAGDDNEIFLFAQNGQHLETRTKDLYALKYKFTYNATTKKLLSFTDIDNRQTVLTYDTNGILTKITAPFGQETLITVNQDVITNVENSLHYSYSMIYDSNRLLTQFSKPNLEVTQFAYNSDGDFSSEQKNNGQSQSFVESIVQGIQSFTKTTATGVKSIFSVTQNNSVLTTESKNGAGGTISKIEVGVGQKLYSGSNTFETTNEYDSIWGSFPKIAPSIITYREANQTIDEMPQTNSNYSYSSATDPRTVTGRVTSYGIYPYTDYSGETFDVATKVLAISNPQNGTTSFTVNTKERLTKMVPPVGVQTTLTYNTASQLSKIQKASSYTNFTYNAYGFLNSIVTSKGQTESFATDAQGNILTTTLPNLETVQYEYTNGGGVKKITTPSNQIHNFQTSAGDYITGYLNPVGGQTSYAYDAEKRINQITYPSGRIVGISYSAGTDSVSQITTTEGNYNYLNTDAQGRPSAIVSPDLIKTEFNWISDQVQQQTWYDSDASVIGTISYGYQSDRLRANQIQMNGSAIADISYDANGRIGSVTTSTNSSFSYSYQTNSTTSNQVAVTGLASTVTYEFQDSSSGNKPLRKVTANVDEGGVLPLGVTLIRTFDNFGIATDYTSNVININTNKVNSYYQLIPTYDLNNRLTQTQKVKKVYVGTTLTTQTEFYNQYTFPANSNGNVSTFVQRPTLTATPTKSTAAVYSADDRLTSLTGTLNRTYSYTADGHLSSMTDAAGTTIYIYDDFSNLKQVTYPSGKVVQYKVDGLNRRAKKIVNGVTTEYYLWYDQTHLAAVLDGSKNVVLTYLYGPESSSPSYVIKNGITYRIIQDPGLGSIRYIIDPSTRIIAQEIEYDEFGNMVKNTDSTFQPLGFEGGLVDSEGSGFVRFGARDVDPAIGRWTTKDPSEFESGGLNLYEYAQSNPMSFYDDEGLASASVMRDELGGAGGGGGGAMIVIPVAKWVSDTFGSIFNQQKGERGAAAKESGTDNPFKHLKPHPKNPRKVIKKDPHTGKDIVKDKPSGFDDYWNAKKSCP